MSLPFEQIHPVIVTAPTARNGVTLLQRLLNSSRQIIVYGENKHFCELMPHVVFSANQVHVTNHDELERSRHRFLHETTEFWSSNLWPNTGGYLRQAMEAFRAFVRYYQSCSEEYGYPRWGLKHPFTNVQVLDRFFSLLPTGRFIYIYRNLFDVARSSKARKFATTPQDFAALATSWSDSLRVLRRTRADNLLVIKYEELLSRPAEWIARIEGFVGIQGIKPEVMNKKFNTFRGEPKNGHSPTEYIEPAALTDQERGNLCQYAAEMLAAENYADSAAPEPALV